MIYLICVLYIYNIICVYIYIYKHLEEGVEGGADGAAGGGLLHEAGQALLLKLRLGLHEAGAR